MLFDQLKKWRRWLLWLAALGLLLGWSLTWALDAPQRPVLAEREQIRSAAVHIKGTACGQFSEGSGFVTETGLVLTNAHVVAGVEEITVTGPEGEAVVGELVGFDAGRDIAAISVSGLDVSPIVLAPMVAAEADVGDAATVDRDDGLEFVPFTVKRRIWAKGRDFYGQEAENRRVLEVRSLLAAGDSGAALVNVDGQVWGMVFAVARGERDQGYALDVVEIAEFLAENENMPSLFPWQGLDVVEIAKVLAEFNREPLPTPPCRTL